MHRRTRLAVLHDEDMRTATLSVLTVVAVGAVTAIGTSAAAVAMIPGDSAGEVQSIPAIAVASQSPAEGAALDAVLDGDGPLIASLPPVIALGGQHETEATQPEPEQEATQVPAEDAPEPSGSDDPETTGDDAGPAANPGNDSTSEHGDTDSEDSGDKGPKDKGDKGDKDSKGPKDHGNKGPKDKKGSDD